MVKFIPATLACFLLCCVQLRAADSELLRSLSSEESAWLAKYGNTIRYAPNPSWPPADFVINDSVHVGIIADYMELIESRLGVQFQRVFYSDWSKIMTGLKSGEADFVAAIQPTPERKEFLDFGGIFMRVPLVLVVNSSYTHKLDPENLSGLKITAVEGSTTIEYLRKNYPDAVIVPSENALSALINTSMGHVDGAMVSLMSSSYLAGKYGLSNLRLGTELPYTWELAFGVRKQHSMLVTILDKAMNTISPAERKAIYDKWVNNPLAQQNPGFFQKNLTSIIVISVVGLSLLCLALIHNYILRKRIESNTSELRKEVLKKEEAIEKVRRSEEEYEFLFNNAGLPKWVFEVETLRIVRVNDIAIKMYGYSREEFLNMTILQLRPPEDIPRVLDAIKKREEAKQDESDPTLVYRHMKKNGEVFFVEVFTRSFFKDDNSYRIAAILDVTEKVAALKKLEESIERYKYVMKATNEAVWDWDVEADTVFWGEGFYSLFGLSMNNIKDSYKFWVNRMHPDDRSHVPMSLLSAINSDSENWTGAYRYQKANGDYAEVIDKAIIIRDFEGKATRVVGSMVDVTERNRYLRAVKEQNEKLKEIAWIQSHVVRAPVARIEGLIKLMESERIPDEKTELYYQFLLESVRDLDAITRRTFKKAEEIKTESLEEDEK